MVRLWLQEKRACTHALLQLNVLKNMKHNYRLKEESFVLLALTSTLPIAHLLPLYPPTPQLSARPAQRSERTGARLRFTEVLLTDGCFRVSQASVRVRVSVCSPSHSLSCFRTQRSFFCARLRLKLAVMSLQQLREER